MYFDLHANVCLQHTGPLCVLVTKELLAQRILCRDGPRSFHITVSRADFEWSDQRPDTLVLKGVLHDSQTFQVNYTRVVTRHAGGCAHDVNEDLEENDGEDVPDFSFFLC